jgi:hypothetical protein
MALEPPLGTGNSVPFNVKVDEEENLVQKHGWKRGETCDDD